MKKIIILFMILVTVIYTSYNIQADENTNFYNKMGNLRQDISVFVNDLISMVKIARGDDGRIYGELMGNGADLVNYIDTITLMVSLSLGNQNRKQAFTLVNSWVESQEATFKNNIDTLNQISTLKSISYNAVNKIELMKGFYRDVMKVNNDISNLNVQ